jgi:hypothetical protein
MCFRTFSLEQFVNFTYDFSLNFICVWRVDSLASHAIVAQLVKKGVPCCIETDVNMNLQLDCAMKQLKPIDVLMPYFLRIHLGSLLSLSGSSFQFSNIMNSELPR